MSWHPTTKLACSACGAAPAADAPWPFRCPNAGRDDADHLLVRRLVREVASWPPEGAVQPFVRFRTLLHAYDRARSAGMRDGDFVGLVETLDRAVAAIEGHGFAFTPFTRSAALGARLGLDHGVWVKDETGNVAGSHKARHLFGLALHLDVAERLGLAPPRGEDGGPPLAIASCGNAALAAALVAHAARRPLEVFVPPDAELRVIEALRRHGARITVCPRVAGERGDPCMLRFREALDRGALPFCCQGSENGLTLEGGETLGWEMASQLAEGGTTLDRLFIQIGGGALASATLQALDEARSLGAIVSLPRLHAVQTRGAWPLARAYEKVASRALRALGRDDLPATGREEARARMLQGPEAAPAVREALDHAARQRAEFMWPWEETPRSLARGILDDETYDWRAVVEGMLLTGGWPLVVSEEQLVEAHRLTHEAAGIAACHTGSAGLAGLVALREQGRVGAGERVAVIASGVER